MDIDVIEKAFSFLETEYYFIFEGIKMISYIGYTLPYKKNNYGIVIDYEVPFSLTTTVVNISKIQFDNWWEWQPQSCGISKYVDVILKERKDVEYNNLHPEVFSIYKKLEKNGITQTKRYELQSRLLYIEVQAVRLYLDHYWPEI